MRSMPWLLLLFASLIVTARAQTSPPVRDPYARLIARADAVVLGRVSEAGIREVPDGADGVTSQAFVRLAVERWIAGPDTNQTLEVKLSPYDLFLEELGNAASQSDRRVILYLARAGETWWLVREIGYVPGSPPVGLEVLSTAKALDRIPAIRREAEAASPESLAAQADLVVVGSLGRRSRNRPGVPCRVERVLAGTLADSTLTVITETRLDLHHGRALLLLVADSNSAWKVLNDGAGCYFFDGDRLAHFAAAHETVFARIAAAHARRDRGSAR